MSLFHKVLVFGDPHFGRASNSPQANRDNLDFLQWGIDEARTWGAETCIMLGDWHDNRHSIAVATMLASLDGMDMLNTAFKQVWWLPGNHDLLFKERRDAASIEFARWLPNITIVRHPMFIGGVNLVPWLTPGEHTTLNLTGRYGFAHLETSGFFRNTKSIVPETDHTVSSKDFPNQDCVFTGHYHIRQMKDNVCYIGSAMPHNFNDDGDADRGIMLLQWGHDPIFRAWPGQPLYRSIKLTELLDDTTVLKPNMTLRVLVDMPLTYEEAEGVREALVGPYGLRKLELSHCRDEVDQEVDNNDIAFQTVDQIVCESLEQINSVGMSNQRLIEIYQSLI